MGLRDNEVELMARGRRGRLLESRSKKLARECNLDWTTLQRFRKANQEDINTLMVAGFDDRPTGIAKAQVNEARNSLKAKAKVAGIDWDKLLKFLEGLGPIIATFMSLCG